jgi:hypothetical protein
MRQAEPAAFASRLFRILAGHEAAPWRRNLAGIVVAIVAVLSIPILLGGILGLVTITGIVLTNLFPIADGPGPAVSWWAVWVLTVGFLAIAITVSWTSRRRSDEDERSAHRGAPPGMVGPLTTDGSSRGDQPSEP